MGTSTIRLRSIKFSLTSLYLYVTHVINYSPVARFFPYIMQATESWAGPGNEPIACCIHWYEYRWNRHFMLFPKIMIVGVTRKQILIFTPTSLQWGKGVGQIQRKNRRKQLEHSPLSTTAQRLLFSMIVKYLLYPRNLRFAVGTLVGTLSLRRRRTLQRGFFFFQ